MPELALGDLLQIARAAVRHPSIALRFASAVARLNLVHGHYRRYPRRYEPASFRSWARTAARLIGTQTDSSAALA